METKNVIDRDKRKLKRASREAKTTLLIAGASAMTGVVIGMVSGLSISRKISKECGRVTIINVEAPTNILDELECNDDDDNNDDI